MKKKLHILAVDDEPAIGASITYALEAPHRKIVVAKDGHDALAKVAKEEFDVVISDHRMPRSGGLDLVRKLRERNYHGRIVILSAHLLARKHRDIRGTGSRRDRWQTVRLRGTPRYHHGLEDEIEF
jgi:DNA-binding response OmpR family regulator